MRKKFAFIFGAAFLVRLISLNQSLWLDEAITAKVIKQFSLFEIPYFFSSSDFHPPLYYLFMKMWSFLFGSSEIALRMPSVIFSILTGHAIFLIGTRWKSERLGLWAATLYLFNPLSIYYSQEARMYSMVTFLLTFALYFCLEIIGIHGEKKHLSLVDRLFSFFRSLRQAAKNDSQKLLFVIKDRMTLYFLFNLAIVLAMWTFYGSIFIISALLFLLLRSRQYKPFLISLAVLIISSLLQYPLMLKQLAFSKVSLSQVANWSSVLGTVSLKNLFLIPVKFSLGRLSFYPKWIYYLVSGLWTVFVFCFVFLGGLVARRMFSIIVISLLLGLVFSFFFPLLQYFRFLYLLPCISLLIAMGVERYLSVKRKKGFLQVFGLKESKKLVHIIRENAIFEILLGGFMFFSFAYLFLPQFHREDWKAMSKTLPHGKNVYMILSSSDPLTYYRKDITLYELRNINRETVTDKELYVIPYTASVYGFDYEKALNEKGCYMKQRYVFREIFFEKWNCEFISSSDIR